MRFYLHVLCAKIDFVDCDHAILAVEISRPHYKKGFFFQNEYTILSKSLSKNKTILPPPININLTHLCPKELLLYHCVSLRSFVWTVKNDDFWQKFSRINVLRFFYCRTGKIVAINLPQRKREDFHNAKMSSNKTFWHLGFTYCPCILGQRFFVCLSVFLFWRSSILKFNGLCWCLHCTSLCVLRG